MALTLGQFLGHDSVRRADPLFLGRSEDHERQVTWAHSSEIYEIAPLLSGGEVLLTTGLGLAGADAGSRRHWVRDLAARQVAAVAVEPGRSLPELPPEVADEARRVELPLIVLRQVVPFALICREINADILTADLGRLRRADDLVGALHELAADGAGLVELITLVARELGEPVVVRTLAGQVVAAVGAHRHLPTDPAERHGEPAVVRTAGSPWGHVLLGHPECDQHVEGEHSDLARRVAGVVGLVIERSALTGAGPDIQQAAASLLTDLLDRPRFTSAAQLLTRGALAGFLPGPGQRVVGLVAACADPPRSATVLGRVPGLGPHLLASVRGQVLGLLGVDAQEADPAGRLAQRLQSTAVDQQASLVVGPPVDLDRAGESLLRAREGLDLGDGEWGALTWRESTLPHLLAKAPAEELAALVQDALGPVLRWDAEHGSSLLDTLHAWLGHGLNIAATARTLGVRRQSVHQRLDRVSSLLGYVPGQDRALTHLVVACAAARVTGHGRQRPRESRRAEERLG